MSVRSKALRYGILAAMSAAVAGCAMGPSAGPERGSSVEDLSGADDLSGATDLSDSTATGSLDNDYYGDSAAPRGDVAAVQQPSDSLIADSMSSLTVSS
ncbi:MAG: hypothetical protein KDD69_09195, partial [Bdellovibrionales bacterium]|nr:hypothetical protein [Bdellovibrionales bacterium]